MFCSLLSALCSLRSALCALLPDCCNFLCSLLSLHAFATIMTSAEHYIIDHTRIPYEHPTNSNIIPRFYLDNTFML
jgi:hypothetical protein